MWDSIRWFVEAQITPEHVQGKTVLESGSLDYNGSIRSTIEAMNPKSYLGTDMLPGPGVDLVCKAEDLHPESADLVLSFEMLEHAEDWRAAILGLHSAIRGNGFMALSTRSPGFPNHSYPNDYNRFTLNHMARILLALGMDIMDLSSDSIGPGVLAFAQKADLPDVNALAFIEVETAPEPDPSWAISPGAMLVASGNRGLFQPINIVKEVNEDS